MRERPAHWENVQRCNWRPARDCVAEQLLNKRLLASGCILKEYFYYHIGQNPLTMDDDPKAKNIYHHVFWNTIWKQTHQHGTKIITA
jgi:hypothetical protein